MRDPGRRCSTEWYRLVMGARSRRTATRWRRSSRSRASSSRARTGRRPRARPRSTSRASCAKGRPPRRCPRRRFPTAIPSICRRLLVERLGLGSTSEARRLIAQGAVKVDGEVVSELDLPRERARRSARAGRESAASCASPGLTPRADCCYHSAAARKGGVEDSPCNSTRSAFGRRRIRRRSPQHLEASGASRRLFYAPAATATVFENSAACELRRDLVAPASACSRRHYKTRHP